VRAYKSIQGLKDDAKLSTWLFGIAKNVARESLRSRVKDERRVEMEDGRVLELSDRGLLPDRELLDRELNKVIHGALGDLDEDKRLGFTVNVCQHRTYEQIAEI